MDASKLIHLERPEIVETRANAIPEAQAELDLSDLLDNLFDPNNQVMYDLRVDDREFKEFPNFLEFALAKEGLNSELWSRQFWIALSLLHEICPVCTTKYRSVEDVPKRLKIDEFIHNVTLLNHGVCSKCGNTKSSLLRKKLMRPYQELAGLAGQRVGKSLLVSAIQVYLTHKFLKMQDPSKIYGVLPTTFVGTMVGLTFDKAVQQLWLPYKGFIDNSSWFRDYHAMLRDTGKRMGVDMLRYGQNSLHYVHRQGLFLPSGPNRKTLRGNTRIFASCVVGDTEVNTNFGKTAIKHIRPGLHRAIVGGKDYEISRVVSQGRKPVFKLLTDGGLYVIATADHKFRRAGEWVQLCALKAGDTIAVEYYMDTDHKIESITEAGSDYVYDITVPELGFFVADGIIAHNCDEFDFFNTEDAGEDQVKMNGIEIHKSLTNSLLTVRVGWRDAINRGVNNVSHGYQLNISSPQSQRGVLTQMVMRNRTSRIIYCFHLATWDIHPKITEADIRRDYADDPEKADRDFGAIPPRTEHPFLTMETATGMSSTARNLIETKYVSGRSPSGVVRRAARITRLTVPSTLPPAALILDAGYSNNSFAAVLGIAEKRLGTRYLKFPLLTEVIPERGKIVLDYTKIAELLLYPIIEKLNVQIVIADRWNSLKQLHDIEDRFNIPTEQYSIRYNDFIAVRSYMEDGVVKVPARETDGDLFNMDGKEYPRSFVSRPCDHFVLQAATVCDGLKDVTKGVGLTDDIWRCVALGATKLMDDEWCEKYLKTTKKGGNRGVLAVAGNFGVFGVDGHGSLIRGKPDMSVGAVGTAAQAATTASSLYGVFGRRR